MKCFVINLDRRPERWVVIREHLADLEISITRFTGIDNGWRGCRDSHIECIRQIWQSKEPGMVLEDDAEFIASKGFINDAMLQLPKDWDALFLGASPQEPQQRYSNNLFRLKNAWCMHAVIWNPRKNGAMAYILDHKEDIQKIDVFMAQEIMPRFNVFISYPMIVHQRVTDTSDTCKRSDVTTIDTNYQKYISDYAKQY
jgi:GR25 family glycosyltransferase involved in LPS biosynthesis